MLYKFFINIFNFFAKYKNMDFYIIGRTQNKELTVTNTEPTEKNVKYKVNYYNVRNNAWNFLLTNNVNSCPINLKEIIKNNGWKLFTYDEYTHLSNYSFNDLISVSESGCTVTDKKNTFYHILVNPSGHNGHDRFTIAHEIGHIILHKVYHGTKLETEANMFAARILMPMFLIKELKIETIDELAKLCGVSYEAARLRLERFEKINYRDKFYTNPLESKLKQNFEKFIMNYKKD